MAAGVDTAGTPGLYVFGGNVNGVAVARSFRFFGDQGWREIAPMPAPRSQGAAVAIGGRIVVVGGAQNDRLVSPTYVYDTATDRWTTAAPIPTPRDHLGGAALDGRVCAVGGRRLSLLQNLATFECYDPAADRWQSMADAPTARGGIGAATIGSRLFVAGGEQPLGTFSEVDVFDASAAKWTHAPALPTARHGLGVVAVGSTLYVMSGGPTPGASQTAVCEALDVR
jgi:non-specific serine/threonine protein kinase